MQTFSTDHFYQGQAAPQCKAMLDTYCNFLNSPGVMGNLEVKRATSSTKVLQGDTPNQFSQVYYRYALAKLRNRGYLPKDFVRVLDRHAYFGKLKIFLDREPRQRMNLSERLIFEQMDYELGFIWQAAFNETAVVRMDRKFVDFHKLPDKLVPVELQLERRRVKRELISEISRALWRNSEEWGKVEAEFVRLQKAYTRMISRLDIDEAVKADWTRRVGEIKLVLPGAYAAISNEECSTTTVNAYYYTYLNVVTICAGDFNSEDISQTLSHEMAHALGIDRTQYLFEIGSDFGRRLSDFRRRICEPKTFSCGDWATYKAGFDKSLTSLNGYKPQLPEFQSCLKRRPAVKRLSNDDIERFARTLISDRVSDLASSDRFLRITKPSMPLRNGKIQRNPNYMNPCSYYLWSQGEEPIDDELTTLMYFTAEYKCSDEKLGSAQRMKNAIELAKEMSEQVLQKSLAIEGEFSARSLLETEGFSSPPFERFADVVGSYAMAELLSQSPDLWDRQNRFLASSSWQCIEPSLASQFPEESSIEKEYIFDAHTEGDQRRKELFSQPIRQVIGCQKDFEFKECTLPFNAPAEGKAP
ncbi:MAG: hypothetical protein KF799_00035 [Bdellovibrionales bacterium]|nr:hypothetical protein [Bdellovibrionales bacterium]